MDNILNGPELTTPVPIVSLGIRLYETMRTLHSGQILYIDAATGNQTIYKDFLTTCCRLARSLQNCGYKQNDIISITSENNSLYNIPIVAALFLGMISAPLNQNYTEGEFSHMFAIIEPKIIFSSIKVLDALLLQKKKFSCVERIIVLEEVIVDGHDTLNAFIDKYCEKDFCVDEFRPVEVDPFEQVAVMLCSSGTTGMPKAVMITHDNIAMRANQVMDPACNLGKREIIALSAPNFHAYALTQTITSMLKGNTLVNLKRFVEADYLKAIEKYKINNLPIVPTIACILVKSHILQRFDVSSVEEIFCGSAPLDSELVEGIVKRFPNLKCLRQAYGMTESTLSVVLMPSGVTVNHSTGKVTPATSIYIRDIENGKALGSHQIGEICIKGRLVTKGYYRNHEATKNTYVHGWIHSGDLGYYDEDGFIFVIGRIKEMIKYKGFQVSPTEIEKIISRHPQIQEVCVVGKPDELAGELPTAFVVKQPGSNLTEKEIMKLVTGELSKTKHLYGGVHFVEDLPRTSLGKVMRSALKKKYFN